MSKIRMNTEFRNKILNRYVEHAETETTLEQQAFLQAREKVDILYPQAFELAKLVVGRAYPNNCPALIPDPFEKGCIERDVNAKMDLGSVTISGQWILDKPGCEELLVSLE